MMIYSKCFNSSFDLKKFYIFLVRFYYLVYNVFDFICNNEIIMHHTCLINFFSSLALQVNLPPTSATIGQDGKPRSLAIWSNISTFGEYICSERPNLSTDTSAGVNNFEASEITTLYLSRSLSTQIKFKLIIDAGLWIIH